MAATIFVTFKDQTPAVDLFLQKLECIANVVVLKDDEPNPISRVERFSNGYCLRLFINSSISTREKNRHAYVDYLAIIIERDTITTALATIQERIGQYYANGDTPATVVVFDFDLVIVNENLGIKEANIAENLFQIKSAVDYLVLWSHGTTGHVREGLDKIGWKHPMKLFDVIITRDATSNDEDGNKGAGFVLKKLNVDFGVTSLRFSCLVDDQDANYNDDYNMFIEVPTDGPIFPKATTEILNRLDEILC